MSAHFVGSPYPIPSFNSSPAETSLITRQFLALARGEVAVQVPANGFRVEAVKPEEHYCLKCLVVRTFDVIYGVSDRMPVLELDLGMDVHFAIKRCRVCESETVR